MLFKSSTNIFEYLVLNFFTLWIFSKNTFFNLSSVILRKASAYWCSMCVLWITWTYILIPCKYQGHGTIIGWDMRTKPKKFDEKLKPQGKFLCKFWLCFLPSLTAKQPKNGYENGYEKCHENRHQFLTLKSDQNFCKKFFHEKMFFHDFLTKKVFLIFW